MKYQRLAFGKC